jgi:Tol biopolymer transport system component
VSVDSVGTQGDLESHKPSLSSDGRYVTFVSKATNLVDDDTNGFDDIFLHDSQTGMTSCVSVSPAGTLGNNGSSRSSISLDGRYLAFSSYARNLVANDTNNRQDIFLHDTAGGITSRVSSSTAGTQSDSYSYEPSISSTGRYVVFHSPATNLVQDDTNGFDDVFLHDNQTGVTSLVSVSSAGIQGSGGSRYADVSDDGPYVVFGSDADNLVPGDNNNGQDIFLRDTQTSITSCLSTSPGGTISNTGASRPSISSDGRYVVFESSADNLVPGDAGGNTDIFVRDTDTGITSLVSVSTAGTQGIHSSNYPDISADGRYVTFTSVADNLVPDDTNGFTDIFVHEIATGITSRVSVSESGVEANGNCYEPEISPNGRYVVFESNADNLIDGVTLSGERHIFMAPVP